MVVTPDGLVTGVARKLESELFANSEYQKLNPNYAPPDSISRIYLTSYNKKQLRKYL
jgi:hypothetical protein